MNTKELLAGFKERMVGIDHVVEEIAEADAAGYIYRELLKQCKKAAPKFKPGSVLFSELVPEPQLHLWQDFARDNGKRR